VILGLGHRQRVGKDTSAKLLQLALENRGVTVQIKSFGLPVKWATYVIYKTMGVKEPPFYDECPEAKEVVLPYIGKSPRKLFEEIGQAGTDIYRGTWVEPTLKNISADVCICSDVRNYTEVDAILGRGGEIYRVDNDRVPHNDTGMDKRLASFRTWNGIIPNNGTLDDLSGVIDTLAERIMVRLERNGA
jgi:hypothetical protein